MVGHYPEQSPYKRLCMDECWIIDDSVEGFPAKLGAAMPTNARQEQWMSEWLATTSYGFINPWDELQLLFYRFDEEGFGEMSWEHFRCVMYDSEFRTALLSLVGMDALRRLENRTRKLTCVSVQEFYDIISNKRRRSLKVAVHEYDGDVSSVNNFKIFDGMTRKDRLIHRVAEECLPDPEERKFYEDQYTCCPPPLFMIFITLIQVASFVFYALETEQVNANGPVPIDSIFIYRPDKRHQVWRFLLYMIVHAGYIHLSVNLILQCLVGVLLEMVHGSLRVATIYMSGVLAGSLATSVFDTNVYLVGASGGVYALLAAHAANMLLNYRYMQCRIFRIFSLFLIASFDVGFAIWNRYASIYEPTATPVAYVAHLGGSFAGLTIGIVVLKNFEQRLFNQLVWWVALTIYIVMVILAIVWNILMLRP